MEEVRFQHQTETPTEEFQGADITAAGY